MRQLTTRLTTSLTVLLSVILFTGSISAQDPAKIFKANCASCHKASAQNSIGPGLLGVRDRWPDDAKLIAWVKNSTEYLKTGDAYAVELFNKYNKTVMPPQALSDADIIAVMDWAHKGGDAPAAPAGGATPADNAVASPSTDGDVYFYVLIGLGILLLVLITVLGNVRKSLQSLVNEKKGIVTPPEVDRGIWGGFRYWASNNKKLVAVLGLVAIIWVLKITWDGLVGVGVYQGYAPEQPIKFSHKLHAGDNKIDCQYCHIGVEKSQHAVIPSANVCMNCHSYIQEGPQYGREEISKIYAALDYNPETQQYGSNPKPIQWIRVHSLPDHAYFNHSQHVKVGKIECKQCHGAVDSMDVVKQFSPLTMGWCIDCHRETEVDYKNNAYYAKLHEEFVNDPSYRKGDKFTIGKIGGLECSKCHY